MWVNEYIIRELQIALEKQLRAWWDSATESLEIGIPIVVVITITRHGVK